MKKINIAVIGHKFMGKAHTFAYTNLPIFFDIGVSIEKKVLCARSEDVHQLAHQWGYERSENDWNKLIDDPEIDVIDISAPSSIHKEVAIAAAQAGKHIFCEKPLALNLEDAEQMTQAVKKAGVINMVGFNYRYVPAIRLAKQLIEAGRLGDILHFRGTYLQDWLTNPEYPLVWRLQKKHAGFGSHGDLGAHVVDLARFLVGEISEVCCQQRTFRKSRPVALEADGLFAKSGDEYVAVDVDDASAFMLSFKGSQAMGFIEVSRNATGHKNQNRIEISGTKGSIIFTMERMCELAYYNVDDEASGTQGFRIIQLGGDHPFMSNWWPAGHGIGYGESFVNQAYDFIVAVKENKKATPNFEDGLICQRVLEAAQRSNDTKRWECL